MLTSIRVLFMREFETIDVAESVEKLRLRLKPEELNQFGGAFIPEYVYEAIKGLPRFASLKVCHKTIAST